MISSITSSITRSQQKYLDSLEASLLDVWNVTQGDQAALDDIKDKGMTEERLMLALAYDNLKKSNPALASQMLHQVARNRLRLKKQRQQDPTFRALDNFIEDARKKGLISGQKASAVMRYALGKSELSEGVENVSNKRLFFSVQGAGKSNLDVCLEKTLTNKSAAKDDLIVARYLSGQKAAQAARPQQSRPI